MEGTFKIEGMTCGGCVSRVKDALDAIPGMTSVEVNLSAGTVKVQSNRAIKMDDVQRALAPLSHYSVVGNESKAEGSANPQTALTRLQLFWPLILIGLFLFGVSTCTAWDSTEPVKVGMEVFMGGFFLVFSFFKFLDLRGFVRSYTMYDLLAKRSIAYAWIYPFLELALGFGWAFVGGTFEIALFTSVLMGFSAVGVILAVSKKQSIPCACLGTVFQLPMTRVTIIEDLLMMIMAMAFLIP